MTVLEAPIISSIIGALGSTCLGLVWGWLIGTRMMRMRRPWRFIASVLLATLVLSAEVAWFQNWMRSTLFVGATLFAFSVHFEWRSKLSRIRNLKY